jgi:hypothetical protein
LKKRRLIKRIENPILMNLKPGISDQSLTLIQRMEKSPARSEQRLLTSASSPGLREKLQHLPLCHRISERPIHNLRTLPQTQKALLMTSYPHQDVCPSLLVNGSTSSNGSMLISPKSSTQLIRPNWTQRKCTSSMMKLNSPFRSQSPQPVSELHQTIILPSPSWVY